MATQQMQPQRPPQRVTTTNGLLHRVSWPVCAALSSFRQRTAQALVKVLQTCLYVGMAVLAPPFTFEYLLLDPAMLIPWW